MNSCFFIGRFTADPETKFTNDGKAVVNFTLAVPRMKNNESDFIRCVAFGKTGETIAEYCKKGNRFCVQGQLKIDSFKKDGKWVNNTQLVVNSFTFLEQKTQMEESKPYGQTGFQGADPWAKQAAPF